MGPGVGCAIYYGSVDGGKEIRLFDPRRDPRDWTDVMRPGECAVFLKDRIRSVPVAPDGRAYPKVEDTTCVVFDRIDAALRFCEAKVRELSRIRCEIYDARGVARPPLMVVVHPDFEEKDDSSSWWSRRRKAIAITLLLMAGPLIWIDVRYEKDFAMFLALNCVLTGLRFLYWNFGVRSRERERVERLETHRKLEAADSPPVTGKRRRKDAEKSAENTTLQSPTVS